MTDSGATAMSDSDIVINVNYSADSAERKTPAGKQKKQQRWLRKKMQFLERKGYVEGKHKNNRRMGRSRYDQTPQRHNGASAELPSLPTSTHNEKTPLSSTAGSSDCSSTPSSSSHCLPSTTSGNKGRTHLVASSHKPTGTKTSAGIPTKYLAIDCEMVGAGPKGSVSQLARCSVVSYEGDVVYDKFIIPSLPVTDYRTRWSGIRPRDLANATPYSEARKEVKKRWHVSLFFISLLV